MTKTNLIIPIIFFFNVIIGFAQNQDTIVNELESTHPKIGIIDESPSLSNTTSYSGVLNSDLLKESNISASDIDLSQKMDATRIMQSKIAGLSVNANTYSPGASSRIIMRGYRSFTQNNQPLILLNGMPIDNSEWNNINGGTDQSNRLLDIDPNLIESIDVVKSAAGRAKYGIVGGNGVIHIKTKKGYKSKPRITLTTSFGLDQVSALPALQSQYGQGITSNGDVQYLGPETRTAFSWGPNVSDLFFDGDASYPFDNNGALVYNPNGSGNPANVYDPYDFFENGMNSNISLNFAGGGDRFNYFVTASRNNHQGIIPTTNYNRNNFSAILDYKINSKFSVQLNGLLSKSEAQRNQTGSNLQGVMFGLLRTPVTFDNANGLTDPINDPSAYEFADGTPRAFRPGIYDNPYWSLNKNKHDDTVNRRIIKVSGQYDITQKLNLLFNLGTDFYKDNRVGGIDRESNFSGGNAYDRKITYDAKAADLSLQYQIKETKDLKIGSTIGVNYNIDETTYDITEGFVLLSPNNVSIDNAVELEISKISNQVKRAGAVLSLDASFKDLVNMTGSLRQDYSNKFGKDTNGFLSYGLGVGISISNLLIKEENPMAERPFNLQLLTSIGKFGNEPRNTGNTPRYVNANISGDGFINSSNINQLEINNAIESDFLTAESNTTFDIGLDLSMMKNKINLNVTYYKESLNNLILSERIAASTGFIVGLSNAGSMTNNGFEVSLSLNPINKQNLKWNLTTGFNKNINEVKSIGEFNEVVELGGFFTGARSVLMPDAAYGSILGTGFQRNEEGMLIIGEEGFPLRNVDDILLADPNPDWTMYINNSLRIGKLITFSASLDIKQGGEMYCGTCGTLDYFGRTQGSAEDRTTSQIFEGVTSSGAVNTQSVELAPSTGSSNQFYRTRYGFGGLSEMSIYDASWIRLRNISITYNFSEMIKLKAIKNLSLRFFAENLLVISDYPGIDPETNLTGNSGAIGLEYYNNPGTRRYGVTFQVGF